VGVEKTLADGVWVLLSIGVAVVSTVLHGPPADRALDGTGTNGSEVDLEGSAGLVRGVRPETVVS
jgi:hypothetical protein